LVVDCGNWANLLSCELWTEGTGPDVDLSYRFSLFNHGFHCDSWDLSPAACLLDVMVQGLKARTAARAGQLQPDREDRRKIARALEARLFAFVPSDRDAAPVLFSSVPLCIEPGGR
jgi:hypothetical protein